MKLIEFKIPAGLTVPEGTAEGGTWDEMATFRLKPNGQMCLVAIGEHKLAGYPGPKEPKHEMGEKTVTRYNGMMQGGGNMAGTGAY